MAHHQATKTGSLDPNRKGGPANATYRTPAEILPDRLRFRRVPPWISVICNEDDVLRRSSGWVPPGNSLRFTLK